MKLDSNRAWKEASRNVSRNRDPLAAVAGVFFMLPQLALSLFFPQPEPTAGMSEQQIVELVQGYYLSTLPVLIPMLLLQTLGTLALLSLLGHPSRPTVGGALKLSLANLPTYLGAQILLGLAIGLGGGLLVALLTLTGVAALAVAGLLLVIIVAAGAGLRMSLSAPVVAIEGERSPIRALQRSWQLTAGNSWRLLAFYALFFMAALVIQMLAGIVVGIPLAMVADGFVLLLGSALVSSLINAIVVLYFVAIIGAVRDQLAGPSVEQERRTFD